ncbi:uncharacterized protein LOC123295145 [Chrysoperla carnea]|uniref:uncharacterized protein LOC123295145 n=1 Tax=Chrysoperla carnea TaxID=189513 RepID=UPI001D071476|nr:uncharacterized protein LOC123295145 [Chrysoperla carnea]
MSEFEGTGFYEQSKKAMEEFADIFEKSTSAPGATPLPAHDAAGIATVAVLVVGILFAIVGLFGMAIFIDCRHQTLNRDGEPRRSLRLRIPKFLRRNVDNDTDSIANQMDNENASTTPAAIVITSPTADIN